MTLMLHAQSYLSNNMLLLKLQDAPFIEERGQSIPQSFALTHYHACHTHHSPHTIVQAPRLKNTSL